MERVAGGGKQTALLVLMSGVLFACRTKARLTFKD
jgi:hypothetical protein